MLVLTRQTQLNGLWIPLDALLDYVNNACGLRIEPVQSYLDIYPLACSERAQLCVAPMAHIRPLVGPFVRAACCSSTAERYKNQSHSNVHRTGE